MKYQHIVFLWCIWMVAALGLGLLTNSSTELITKQCWTISCVLLTVAIWRKMINS